MKKKMYLVKYEVLARNMLEALKIGKGTVYEISLVDEKAQPVEEKKVEGFIKNK